MSQSLIDEDKLREEARRQNEFLNGVFGIVSFTLAFSCITFPNPQKAALIGLILIVPLAVLAAKRVPETILILRQLRNENPNNAEVVSLLSEMENKYLGFRSVLKNNLVYMAGVALYVFVLLWPEFVVWVKT